jgi:hypothetical protein
VRGELLGDDGGEFLVGFLQKSHLVVEDSQVYYGENDEVLVLDGLHVVLEGSQQVYGL